MMNLENWMCKQNEEWKLNKSEKYDATKLNEIIGNNCVILLLEIRLTFSHFNETDILRA